MNLKKLICVLLALALAGTCLTGCRGSKEDAAAVEASISINGKYMVSYTLTSNGETNEQRKKDFISAVEGFYR